MNQHKSVSQNISDLQDQIVNSALFIIVILAIVSHTISIFRAIHFGGFGISIYVQSSGLLFTLAVAYFRKQMSITARVYALSAIVLLMMSAGLYAFGFLASGKLFIATAPVFFSFIISYRRAVLTMLLFYLAYIVFGVLYMGGFMHYTFDTLGYSASLYSWLIDSCLIVMIALGLLYVSYNFKNMLLSKYSEVEVQRQELAKHREALEDLVKERTDELQAINKELNEQSLEMKRKNIQLTATMEHLQETQSQLVQSEKMASLGVLTAGVAHEINNPLNFIMAGLVGLENYFEREGTADPERTERMLSSIRIGIDRATSIVAGLNDFSRDSGCSSEQLFVHTILDNCLTMLNHKTTGRIEIVRQYESQSVVILGDGGKLHQVFLNIINNAIQAITASGMIEITTQLVGDEVVISILDNGCGISEESISKVTDPFYTTKSPGQGTGLGMSISYSIIQEHRGRIKYSSELNKGTCAIVTLPIKTS